jgi:hypothetical protein
MVDSLLRKSIPINFQFIFVD